MKVIYEGIPKWHQIDTTHVVVNENGEALLNIKDSNSRIVCIPQYYINGIPGATKDCFIRTTVYARLLMALDLLPDGFGFKVFDAWRPYAVQKYLFEKQVEKLEQTENIDFDIAKEKAMRFVSYPSVNPMKPFVHATGGAIDLTIIDKKGKELNMGTSFDDFSPLAATDYYESSLNDEEKNNRRLLYNIMTKAGFSNYPSEWWHYDYGDAFWASEKKNECAIYGGIYKL